MDSENGQSCRRRAELSTSISIVEQALSLVRNGQGLPLRARELLRGKSAWRRRRSKHLQMPEPGGAAHAAGVSVFRWKNRRVRFFAENVLLQTGRKTLLESRNLRSAPA